ncbi:MAG: hypothetical protein AB1634_07490 [Thermodesulfobacteriota bacterium]
MNRPRRRVRGLAVHAAFYALLAIVAGPIAICGAAGSISVEVLYMSHGPLQPTLQELRAVLARHNDRLTVSWYDVDSEAGAAFMAMKGITGHVPLDIWVNGKDTAVVGGKAIRFLGFPTGAGPTFFQGKWTMIDLAQLLELLTREP